MGLESSKTDPATAQESSKRTEETKNSREAIVADSYSLTVLLLHGIWKEDETQWDEIRLIDGNVIGPICSISLL